MVDADDHPSSPPNNRITCLGPANRVLIRTFLWDQMRDTQDRDR
jgi:hypothetical protein